MISTSDFTKSVLALLMWREDGSDGVQGMTAVGLVVRNRVNAGWNGGDWLAVMEAHDKSSSVEHGDLNVIRWPNLRDPRFQAVLTKADGIYDGDEDDITGGALYYADLAVTITPWFTESILRQPESHPRIGTVGRQTFFG